MRLKKYLVDNCSLDVRDNIKQQRKLLEDAVVTNQNVTEFIPLGAYPNPFRDEITLSFELEQSHRIQIDIYTLNGQKITTLANAYYHEGPHELSWDGTDPSGRVLLPGIYIYTVIIDNSVRYTGKMVKR